jgi:uncharacterized protein (TIGR02246 family)
MHKSVRVAMFSLSLLCIAIATPPLSAQSAPAAGDKSAIKALYDQFTDAFNKKDVSAIMAFYAPDVFVFDVIPPREYPTWDAYKKDWEGLFKTFPGPVSDTVSELHISVVGSMAYTRGINDATFTGADGSKTHMIVRVTDVLRKANGKWLIVQEHVSVPVDLATGKPDMMSTP